MSSTLKYLETHTLEELSNEFGIVCAVKDDMVILNYDMIDSKHAKDHPIVRECRGLVLKGAEHSWVVVQRAFPRFFNLMEHPGDTAVFDWGAFKCYEKLDGSLIKVSWLNDEIFVTTRGSFADGVLPYHHSMTWREAVLKLLSDDAKQLVREWPEYTFVFELCTPWNQVVIYHDVPKVVLTAIFITESGAEIGLAPCSYMDIVKEHAYTSLEGIQAELLRMSDNGEKYEGFVVRDCNGIRIKIKNAFYLKLHSLHSNGSIGSIKSMVPIVLQGEGSEIGSYFPHLKDDLALVQEIIDAEYNTFHKLYEEVKGISDQKTFALAIVGKTPYTAALFMWKRDHKDIFECFTSFSDKILVDRVYSEFKRLGKITEAKTTEG